MTTIVKVNKQRTPTTASGSRIIFRNFWIFVKILIQMITSSFVLLSVVWSSWTSISVDGASLINANNTIQCLDGTEWGTGKKCTSKLEEDVFDDGNTVSVVTTTSEQNEATLQSIRISQPENFTSFATAINATELQLPKCVDVTLSSKPNAPYDDSKCRVLHWIEHSGNKSSKPHGETTVSGCFPLSEFFKSCQDLWRVSNDTYDLSPDKLTLTIPKFNLTYDLGDFFIVDEEAIVCYIPERLQRRRCNEMTLHQSEYELMEYGSILLLANNRALPKACYEHEENQIDSIHVCYPLTQDVRDCNKWGLKKHDFEIMADKRLYSRDHNVYYDVEDYFMMPTGLAALCRTPQKPDSPYNDYTPHAVLYAISAFCLSVAFIIHLLIPTLNYHAKPLLCHIFSLMALYIALCIVKFGNSRDKAQCYATFILMQFFGLASFFWLNVVAFDFWKIFSNLSDRFGRVNCMNNVMCRCQNVGFNAYCIYAFGLPAVLTSLALILDSSLQMQEALDLHLHVPDSCWYQGPYTPLVFFYGPLGIIVIENATFFFLTIWNLRLASKGAEVVNKKLPTQLFKVCLKLFVVMGLCWVIEVVSWATGGDPNIWFFPDLINAAQGIIIFIIYICKPSTWKLLRSKFVATSNKDELTFKAFKEKRTPNKHQINGEDSKESHSTDTNLSNPTFTMTSETCNSNTNPLPTEP